MRDIEAEWTGNSGTERMDLLYAVENVFKLNLEEDFAVLEAHRMMSRQVSNVKTS